MIGNVWYDRTQERVVYNIEDTNYNLLASDADIDQSTEIDSTQRAAQGDGRSPLNIHTSTIGDEMVKAYHGKSRAFSISFKDRGVTTQKQNRRNQHQLRLQQKTLLSFHQVHKPYQDN